MKKDKGTKDWYINFIFDIVYFWCNLFKIKYYLTTDCKEGTLYETNVNGYQNIMQNIKWCDFKKEKI
jgi:hypothetical protein